MKLIVPALAIVLITSCAKNTPELLQPASESPTVSNDVLVPLPCHAISFITNYPIVPAKIPPFRFTKTLYPDTRVKTINMLSRANPVHPAFPPRACETIGKFLYGTNRATFIGTRQIWEYYKTPAGTAAKRSISKENVVFTFFINSYGYCDQMFDNYASKESVGIEYDIEGGKPNTIKLMWIGGEKNVGLYKSVLDKYGNILTFTSDFPLVTSNVRYNYDYSKPTGNNRYSYAPSQNLISQDYSLLEAMQWLPQSSYQLKSVSGVFKANGTQVVQTQYYKNHIFDANRNLVSYTYSDNILQKTSWYCK